MWHCTVCLKHENFTTVFFHFSAPGLCVNIATYVINPTKRLYYFCFKYFINFSRNLNKKKILILTHSYHFWSSLFLCVDLDFHLMSFFFSWTSPNISSSVGLLMMNFFRSYMSEKSLFAFNLKEFFNQ